MESESTASSRDAKQTMKTTTKKISVRGTVERIERHVMRICKKVCVGSPAPQPMGHAGARQRLAPDGGLHVVHGSCDERYVGGVWVGEGRAEVVSR